LLDDCLGRRKNLAKGRLLKGDQPALFAILGKVNAGCESIGNGGLALGIEFVGGLLGIVS
jgi:hypothetical protein